MISSTASTKSLCLTLALHALVGPASAAAVTTAMAATTSEPVALLRPLSVDLSSSRTSSSPPSPRRNASAHAADEEEPELPEELAALIAAARATPVATRTKVGDGGTRYYAAHDDGARCSPKPAAEFEAWEEARATRAECCAAAFGWDYRACVEDATDASPSSASAADETGGWELPEELAAMIAAAKVTPDPAPATQPGEGEGVRYYATYEEGAPCASKPAAEFEGWEEAHATLGECCEAAFSWDYDACMEPSR